MFLFLLKPILVPGHVFTLQVKRYFGESDIQFNIWCFRSVEGSLRKEYSESMATVGELEHSNSEQTAVSEQEKYELYLMSYKY